ncbi:amino acid adenylation domain protein, partial [Colwellia psychrerythraea]
MVINHDAFGIRILQENDDVQQYISNHRTVELPLLDFSQGANPEQAAKDWMDELFQTPINYHDSELCQAHLVKIGSEAYWYVALSHHLAMDGLGFSNWAYKLADYYNQTDDEFSVTDSWQDISIKDQHYVESNRYQRANKFWLEHCDSVPEKLLTPYNLSDFDDADHIPSSRHRVNLPRSVFDEYIQFATSVGVGVPQLILGMLATYFALEDDRDSIAFGIPAHNRKNSIEKKMVCVFSGVSPLIVKVDKSKCFTSLVQQIATLQKASFRHQRFPIGHMMQALGITGDSSTFYDISFNYLKLDYTELVFDGIDADVVYHSHNREKLPLTVTIWDGDGENIELQLDHNQAYFCTDEIQLLAERFVHLLNLLTSATNKEKPLAELSILPAQEIQLLCNELNDNKVDYPTGILIHELFEEQVKKTPDNIALVFDDQQLTYEQLNHRANQLAHYLLSLGVKVETLVGICLDRSFDIVVSVLAILKAGGAYVPLDPSYPHERLAYMYDDANLTVVLTQSHLAKVLSEFTGKAIYLDKLNDAEYADNTDSTDADNTDSTDADRDISKVFSQYSIENLSALTLGVTSSHLGYVIYTSGSTGRPKGVMVEHRNVVSFIHWVLDYYDPDELACVLASTSLNFDLSVFELIAPLAVGGRCLIVENIMSLVEHSYQGITLINTVPSGIQAILNSKSLLTSVRTFNFCGEPLKKNVVDSLQAISKFSRIINLYGPSEDTTYSTVLSITQPLNKDPSIGLPINNTQAYILDHTGRLAPTGTVGELHLGGTSLSRGYLDRPELTAEKFIKSPFNSQNRLYKTGDLVRYQADGNIAFIGRIDDQVKISGYRIELGDIESQLSQCESVLSCLVLAREDELGQKFLVVYVVREIDEAIDETTFVTGLRESLKKKLPNYMVPNAFVMIDEWPLTPNGKTDKKALPEPNPTSLQGAYVSPETNTEIVLVNIWATLLKLDADKISTIADFFELGGNSLLSIRLVSKIRKELHTELSISDIFVFTTIKTLSLCIDNTPEVELRESVKPVVRDSNEMSLSYPQQRLWFIDQLQGGSSEYNMAAAFNITGNFNVEAANQALKTVILRHEVLRTIYVEHDERGALQCIQSEFNFKIHQYDLSVLTHNDRQKQLQTLIDLDAQTPFNLSEDLMLRASFVLLVNAKNKRSQEGVLLFNMHHIASDGWSVEILVHEFNTLYQAIIDGTPNPLSPLEIQYADYAHWQRQWLQGEGQDNQLMYWDKQLTQIPPVHSLLLDNPRPHIKQHVGARVSGQLSSGIAQSLQEVAKCYQLTPFMLLHAALALVISRHSNSDDIVIGTPVANRLQAELEPLIGFFVNSLVLRIDTSYLQLNDYLAHVRQVHLDAQTNQDVPFEQLVERLKIPRNAAHTPLFQIMLTSNRVNELDDKELNLSGITLTPLLSEVITAKFDLDLDISINEEGAYLNWVYDKSIFNEEHIQQFNNHLCRVLTGLAELNEKSIAEEPAVKGLPMLSVPEIEYLITTLNDTQADYPKDICLHELFEGQVKANPDNTALEFEGQQLTYQELNTKANQVAHYLVEQHGITPDTLVGICVERSLDMVVGILGILKAGGAYVPLDPSNPEARLNYILSDANLSVVLTQKSLLAKVGLGERQAVCLDGELLDHDPSATDQTDNLKKEALGLNSSHLAYVIYTSGSTGQPKGVMIEHSALSNLATSLETLALGKDKAWGWLASFAFDASAQGLTQLCLGQTLVILTENEKSDIQRLQKRITQSNIGVLDCSPALLELWISQSVLSTNIDMIVGGEAISDKLWRSLIAYQQEMGQRVYNVYGPTECTVDSCWVKVENDHPTIGSIMPNLQGYVCNSQLQPVPLGSIGELCLSGVGLARGYLRRPELTLECFVANPFYGGLDKLGSDRLYKTGDLVRHLPNGNIEYIGRIDDQVKIRGFRIELSEIEYHINQCLGVDSALVLVKEDGNADKQLVSYIKFSLAAEEDNELSKSAFISNLIADVKGTLKQVLPSYMMPGAFVTVDEWPLTLNGKIDKKALPEPDGSYLLGEYVAAETATEKSLVAIWSSLLKLDEDKISITANFFDLGGHSLLVMRLVSEIRKQLQCELSVKTAFESPCIQALSVCVNNAADTALRPTIIAGRQDNKALFLSFAQERLWFIDKFNHGSAEYNMPAAFDVVGDFDVKAAEQAITRIIARHAVLRTVYIEDEQETLQHIQDSFDFTVQQHDLTFLCDTEKQARLSALIEVDVKMPFNLGQDLMVRVSFILREKGQNKDGSEQQGTLLFNMHHIASDGWSMDVLIREFVTLYESIIAEQPDPLLPLEIQYADYANWQREYLQGDMLASQLSYWDKQLADLPSIHSLILDEPRPEEKQYAGARVSGQLSGDIACSLQHIAKAHQLTPFMLLHAALALVLARHSNSHDIVIGTPVANRLQAELEPLIGFFVNTLVLRLDTNHQDLSDYLAHVREVHLDAQSNQDVPFERLVEKLNISRSSAYTPVFQIMLTTDTDYGLGENKERQQLTLPGVTLSPLPAEHITAKFDLDIRISLNENGVNLEWVFDKAIFNEAHIIQFNDHLSRLLTGLATLNEKELSGPLQIRNLPVLSVQETNYLIREINDTEQYFPEDKCIHELFEAQALVTPNNIALVFEGEQLTYQALNQKANRVANYLVEQHHIIPDTLVGICVERSLDMVVGILGILKSGGAYVPLDPSYPEARLNYILSDADVSLVLTQESLLAKVGLGERQAVCLDGELLEHDPSATDQTDNVKKEALGLNSSHLAYVIYTSGSTGQPKGVAIRHSNTNAMLHWANSTFAPDELS